MRGRVRPIAAVDVGSNSVFLMVVMPSDGGPPVLLERRKHRARLGAVSGVDGRLGEAVIDSVVEVLKGFAATIAARDAETIATATAAVRSAIDGDELVRRAEHEAGIVIDVLDGEAEARMMHRGVRFGGVGGAGRLLCADVGGGSTEVVLGEGNRVELWGSCPLGAVSLSHEFLAHETVSARDLRRVRDRVTAELAALPPGLAAGGTMAVATAGSIQRIARVVRRLGAADPGNSPASDPASDPVNDPVNDPVSDPVNDPVSDPVSDPADNVVLRAAAIDELAERLAACRTHAERRAIPGMDPERADIMLAGTLIFSGLSRHLGIDRWRVSAAGLRAGMVATVLQRRRARLGPGGLGSSETAKSGEASP